MKPFDSNTTVWRECFARWPAELPRRGMLVTNFNEQILFAGFHVGEAILLVERQTPDSVGARQLLVPYGNILAVKIVDVVSSKAFRGFGFEPPAKK